jgi:hypothetical protein
MAQVGTLDPGQTGSVTIDKANYICSTPRCADCPATRPGQMGPQARPERDGPHDGRLPSRATA